MALHAPAIRASTAVFALAACAAFGLAIRDTASGRAPAPREDRPDPEAGAGAAPSHADGAPSAAELAEADEVAEAEAAFAGAAAARAGDPEAIARALRSLLDPHLGPAAWISLSGGHTRDRLELLERLGVHVAVDGRKALQRVQVVPLPDASHVGCADLERAATEVWGPGRRGARGIYWSRFTGAFRAALRSPGWCELRIERAVPLDQLLELVPIDAVGRPASELLARLEERITAELRGAPDASSIEWQDAALEGGLGEARLAAELSGGRVAAIEAHVEVEPEGPEAAAAQLARRFGAPALDRGRRTWRRGAGRVELSYLGGRMALRAGAPRSDDRSDDP